MTMFGEAVLMVRGGPDEGNSIPLSGGMIMIGHAPLNDIVLEQPGVSRQHAGIRGDSEGYWIADLGSRNGTYVNGEQLGAEPRRLKNFDRIELGATDSSTHYVYMESQSPMDIPQSRVGAAA